jgi:RNA polymerase sigma factor (sigma-70 family)
MVTSVETTFAGEVETMDLAALYREHGRRIGSFIKRRTGEGPHVEELLQEAFLHAHARRTSFQQTSAPATWIYGIANNLCRHHNRGWQRWRTALAKLGGATAAPELTADETLVQAQELARARRALARLPDHLREVFVLVELEDLSGEEVAILAGVPTGTVWSRLDAARRRFARHLGRTVKEST